MAKIYDAKVVIVDLEREDIEGASEFAKGIYKEFGDSETFVYDALKRQGWNVSRILHRGTCWTVEVYKPEAEIMGKAE